jgi:hypothetical protein
MESIKIQVLTIGLIIICITACTNVNSPLRDNEAAFNYLKELEGKWEYRDKEGVFGWEFDITSRGSVIVERLRVDTAAEMTTVYHLDNGILRGNHYCQYKNQPQLSAVNSETEGDLHFLCNNSVGNTQSHDEIHMHGVHFQKKDTNLSIWMDIFENGKVVFEPRLELSRIN